MNNPDEEEPISAEDAIKGYYIALMQGEVIQGVKGMTLNEIDECDILYLIELIRYSKKEKEEEAFVDGVGI